MITGKNGVLTRTCLFVSILCILMAVCAHIGSYYGTQQYNKMEEERLLEEELAKANAPRIILEYEEDGSLRTGWYPENGSRVYIRPDGEISTGWLSLGDCRYLLDIEGHPRTGFYDISYDGYSVPAFGESKQIGKPIVRMTGKDEPATYYFESSGIMRRGWLSLDGKKYHFADDGKMQRGWHLIGDYWYCFDSYGVMLTGWKDYNGYWYYLNEKGQRTSGLQEIDGGLYFFDEEGRWCPGWAEPGDGRRIYLYEDGTQAFGWLDLDDGTYYLDPETGSTVSGFVTFEEETYYFNEYGLKCVGCTYVPEKGGNLYFYEDGGYATNRLVDGRYYGSTGTEIPELYTEDYYIHNGNVTYFNVDYSGYGRLYIPDVGICVALYLYGMDDMWWAQECCDAWDSAVAMNGYGPVVIIGDHSNQEFATLSGVYPGMKAFIRRGGNTYVYKCYQTSRGVNDEYDVYDGNGVPLGSGSSSEISMYTCASSWRDIFTCRFSLVEVL